jgi:hypothetical protein
MRHPYRHHERVEKRAAKICLLGAFGVGKTSLTQRFVSSILSDKYLTTSVEDRQEGVDVGATPVSLVIRDGEDEVSAVRELPRGGRVPLVVDVTRARRWKSRAHPASSNGDRRLRSACSTRSTSNWDIAKARLEELQQAGWSVERTSAKTGAGVEETRNWAKADRGLTAAGRHGPQHEQELPAKVPRRCLARRRALAHFVVRSQVLVRMGGGRALRADDLATGLRADQPPLWGTLPLFETPVSLEMPSGRTGRAFADDDVV